MDDESFPQEDIESIVKNAITSTLSDHLYNSKKVNDWINSIVDACLKELQSLNRPFKYVVTCGIMQKNGAGLDTGVALIWDHSKDGLVCIPWENTSMHVIITVFGLALNVDNLAEMD
uniref:Dynein light chain Tctex-type 1 n=1 Tax=Aureoumbra lagunensis TaxID=44058 RepID=A0A7S3JST1_9STRA|mmetsp:Transcript_13727/g.18307  ORF Transcript_13727/g.18307 Transcript_13727/m.18307 type:complete len:117 (+) Transcript_13727:149-499(+)